MFFSKKKKSLTNKQKRMLKETYDIFDEEQKEQMPLTLLKTSMYALNLHPTEDEIERIFISLNRECGEIKKFINFQEFLSIVGVRIVKNVYI
jgi:Ca2+-binding EF-hand superfamily protein